MKKSVTAALLCTALLCGCIKKTPVSTQSVLCADCGFDTVILLQNIPSDQYAQAEEILRDEFLRYDAMFDIYSEHDGGIYQINAMAGKEPVKTATEVIDVLLKAKEYYTYTDGAFDAAMGSVLQIWHNAREAGLAANKEGKPGEIPDDTVLQEAAAHTGWDSIQIDEEAGTVFISDPDASLDLGGIAKGYAAGKAAQRLAEEGFEQCVLSAGGNVVMLGEKENGKPWRIGIQDPNGSGVLAAVEWTGSGAVVTSGDYERCYTGPDGTRYHHIIDPRTCMPADHCRSVTVCTEDAADADALSTALFVLSVQDGEALLEKWREDHPDSFAEAVWLLEEETDTKMHTTGIGGLHAYWTDGLEGKLDWNK